MDGNGNFTCDEADEDVKRRATAPAGVAEVMRVYIGRAIESEGLCDRTPLGLA